MPWLLVRFSAAWMVVGLGSPASEEAPPDFREETRVALKRAVDHYREKVARHGGYVYYTGLEDGRRWGEGEVDPDTIFVQPPATPTVGMAFLRAHQASRDPRALDAARAAARALMHGQLASGGWTQAIHFGPAARRGKYRNGQGGDWNASSLDDDQTPAALRFLIALDVALNRTDEAVREAVMFGLDALLAAQFPNGGFPQVWREPVAARPVLRARYPDHDWRVEGKIKNYWDQYTLNDNLAGAVARVLVDAHRAYGGRRYLDALARLGDFLVLAQMPDPQPAWCQQYSEAMVPIWARKFEPPAVTGWESQDAIETLIVVARETGQARCLEPIPRALAYLRASLLPDGRLARYYELRTNRPLYMDGDYRLTHDPSRAPSHYGWTQPSRLDALEAAYLAAKAGKPPVRARASRADLEREARRVVAALDSEGRWVSTHAGERLVGQPRFATGYRYLSSAVFAENVAILCDYLTDGSPRDPGAAE